MGRHRPAQVTQEDRDTYARDGAVCLRRVYDRTDTTALLEAWDGVLADPGAFGLQTALQERRETGPNADIVSRPSFTVPEFKQFLGESPVPALLGALTGSRLIGFYWDTIFAKDAGSTAATSWHHDAAASATRGEHRPNAWTPLTPTTPENGVEVIAGSHKWDVLYWPRSPNGSRLEPPPGRPLCPDFEDRRDDPDLTFLGWDMEPGDILVLHPRTHHFSRGNRTDRRRVAYATWWWGDDVVWDPRPECEEGHPEAPFAQMPAGERPNHPYFPIRWRAG